MCPSGGAFGTVGSSVLSAFYAFPAIPLVHSLINVGGKDHVVPFDVVSGRFGASCAILRVLP